MFQKAILEQLGVKKDKAGGTDVLSKAIDTSGELVPRSESALSAETREGMRAVGLAALQQETRFTTRPKKTKLDPVLDDFFAKKWLREFFDAGIISTPSSAAVPGLPPHNTASPLQRYLIRIQLQYETYMELELKEEAAREEAKRGDESDSERSDAGGSVSGKSSSSISNYLRFQPESKLKEEDLQFLFSLEHQLFSQEDMRTATTKLSLFEKRAILIAQLCHALQESFLFFEQHKKQLVRRSGAAAPTADLGPAKSELQRSVPEARHRLLLRPLLQQATTGAAAGGTMTSPAMWSAGAGATPEEGPRHPGDEILSSVTSPFGSKIYDGEKAPAVGEPELQEREESTNDKLVTYQKSDLYKFLKHECYANAADLTEPHGYLMIRGREQEDELDYDFVPGFDTIWNAVLKKNPSIVKKMQHLQSSRSSRAPLSASNWYAFWGERVNEYKDKAEEEAILAGAGTPAAAAGFGGRNDPSQAVHESRTSRDLLYRGQDYGLQKCLGLESWCWNLWCMTSKRIPVCATRGGHLSCGIGIRVREPSKSL